MANNHSDIEKRLWASADFIKAHKHNPSVELSVYGQERVDETRQLCLMNLAVHALSGDIRQGNTYYEDLHESVGKFDFVMANPPFNVDKVDKEKIKADPRFPLGMPRADNANYLWIELFYSALNAKGRAGFVMANSAADARQSEMEIRKKLLMAHALDVMIAIGPTSSTRSRSLARFGSWIEGAPRPTARTRCSFSTPGISSGRWTGRIASSALSRLNTWPTSRGSIAARIRSSRRRTTPSIPARSRV